LRRGIDLFVMNATIALLLVEAVLRVGARVSPSPLLVTAATSDSVRRATTRKPGP